MELVAVEQHLKQAEPYAETSGTAKMMGSYEFIIWFVGQSGIFEVVMGSSSIVHWAALHLFASLLCLDRMGKINTANYLGRGEI